MENFVIRLYGTFVLLVMLGYFGAACALLMSIVAVLA